MSEAKEFARMLTEFAATAAKMQETDDIDAAYDEASKRLVNKAAELSSVVAQLSQAKEEAAKIVSDGKQEAQEHIRRAETEREMLLAEANTKAHQLILNATGAAEARKQVLGRENDGLLAARNKLSGEVADLTQKVVALRREADGASDRRDALLKELAALKERF
jgi:vacuolar-type H+-ATPase subunit H